MLPATIRFFPLIARYRPVCQPLPDRVDHLVALTDEAVRDGNHGAASSVFNQAALLASDIGLPDLARAWCHRHAHAYLDHPPRIGMDAIRGLEPVVNLARLHIRAGNPDEGLRLLSDLHTRVRARSATVLDGITIPADLTETDADHAEVTGWLWRVLLADGTRTLTSTGHWNEALAHVQAHRGVGERMLDGRQVAILTAHTRSDHADVAALVTSTEPGEAWENAVTAALGLLCLPPEQSVLTKDVTRVLDVVRGVDWNDNLIVFRTRLVLAVLDAANSLLLPEIGIELDTLIEHVVSSGDGYAARELLAHPAADKHIRPQQRTWLTRGRDACALDTQALTTDLTEDLDAALATCERIITSAQIRRLSRTPSQPVKSFSTNR